MMPSPELFVREVRALGVNRGSRIVVYDRVGIYSNPRAWWMFKAMGHAQIAVLDGGLPVWLAAAQPVQSAPQQVFTPGDFVAQPRPELFCDLGGLCLTLWVCGGENSKSNNEDNGSENVNDGDDGDDSDFDDFDSDQQYSNQQYSNQQDAAESECSGSSPSRAPARSTVES